MEIKMPNVIKCDRCGRLSPVEDWEPVYEDPLPSDTVRVKEKHKSLRDGSLNTQLTRALARGAATKLSKIFWTAFLASDNFFSEANGNLIDGRLDSTGAGLATALKAFRTMRTPATDGSQLVGGPVSTILVSVNDEINARQLLNSSTVVGGSSTIGSANPFYGLGTLVVSDYLADASVGGTEDTSEFYLLRATGYLASMYVLALAGRVEPTIESSDVDFQNLGIAFRGYSDVGVCRAEPLAALKVSGSVASS